jgi:hypothetical protein
MGKTRILTFRFYVELRLNSPPCIAIPPVAYSPTNHRFQKFSHFFCRVFKT